MRGTILSLVLALAGGPALAAEERAAFDLVLRGLGAGSVAFAAVVDDDSYAVSGQLRTGGLVALVRRVRYDATVQGAIRDGRFVPWRYTEDADTGRRQSRAVMDYRAGVPQVKAYDPPREPRPYDVDPATMGGTVDPLTGLFATLRDVDPGQECRVDLQMFDGRRHTRIRTADRAAEGDRVTCAGEYRRIAGYSAEDLAERTRFPFTLTYAPGANGRMQVVEVAMETLYGRARLIRR